MEAPKTRWRRSGAAAVAGSGAGAALVAALAGSCCVPVLAPLLVALLGAGGAAWAAGLAPYSPYLLAGSLGLLLVGFWSVYRSRTECQEGACPDRRPRGVVVVLWLAGAVWIAALLLNVLTGR